MMMTRPQISKRGLVPLALAGFALWQWMAYRRRHPKLGGRHKPAELHTWEGEGGALAETGSQVGPDPVRS